ncbi:DNA-methyltransferase [Streptomyces phytophilus]|uniref:DNA-methyltransferase n=1 Tax=Streptomyces phytophilus TaxID=722715 RepID=UPI002867EF20|nr:site-specific DNA-methyltransferase [Streptomyces phytophilus]
MSVYHHDDHVTLLLGKALEQLATLPDGSVDCIVTSPPYYCARDYGDPGQYGLEASPAEYVATQVAVFREARRVLTDDGTCWINVGDTYGSAREIRSRIGITSEPRRPVPGQRKSLLLIPERLATALVDDGWTLRNKIVWRKTSCMPERVDDRLSRRHEYILLLTKQDTYTFNLDAIREKPAHAGMTSAQRQATLGRHVWHGPAGHGAKESVPSLASHPAGPNPGDVWDLPSGQTSGGHFATFPIDLPIRCIKAGCKPGGTVLDPFSGSGTTGEAAVRLLRKYIGIDLRAAYHDLAIPRFAQPGFDFEPEPDSTETPAPAPALFDTA